MSLTHLPSFTPEARNFWDNISPEHKRLLRDNVFCSTCRGTVTIVDYEGAMTGDSLLLQGRCARCGGSVARFIECK